VFSRIGAQRDNLIGGGVRRQKGVINISGKIACNGGKWSIRHVTFPSTITGCYRRFVKFLTFIEMILSSG
jgi:hypothetical protein